MLVIVDHAYRIGDMGNTGSEKVFRSHGEYQQNISSSGDTVVK